MAKVLRSQGYWRGCEKANQQHERGENLQSGHFLPPNSRLAVKVNWTRATARGSSGRLRLVEVRPLYTRAFIFHIPADWIICHLPFAIFHLSFGMNPN